MKVKKKNYWHGETIGKGVQEAKKCGNKMYLYFLWSKDCPSSMTPKTKVQNSIESVCKMRLERIEFTSLCHFEKL